MPEPSEAVFLVEAVTVQGRVSETFSTLADALRRADAISASERIMGPLVYQELADGSQRIVRDDGKPLQAHRHAMPLPEEEALPLAQEDLPLGEPRPLWTPQDDG